MHGNRALIALVTACALSACGSTPHQIDPLDHYLETLPYWTNPFWESGLYSAAQSEVHMPANAASSAVPGIHGTVQFTFADGAIKDPVIVVSTGNPDLDKLLLQQVVSAKAPKPTGPYADEPHKFELPLDVFTPLEFFEYKVYAAIDQSKVYYRRALLSGDTGNTTVGFDYQDAKALNIAIVKSSGHNDLDQPSIDVVSKAALPAPPPGYTGSTLHMQVIFCYDINFAKKCPTGNNVIDVQGMRIQRNN